MKQSPCVAHCGLNDEDFCMGCYRHIDEIVGWSAASDEQKAQIWQKLAERKALMQGGENSAILSRDKWLEAEARLKHNS
ncbi:DUF1289 domain-containing protein [Shewanella sp. MBTL60-007]|uniref:DUF1289 domain-containing protein n=1 Tax=Shewanella sp. MBTL60-007 TaxID=2815911 RepID=UPI001BBEFB6E|nr:DUF1289 domain-containing protein [Shewanella sp. MBTL60-007]GIU17743.1 DUF1289 domain-containing protein [Shewanella sp. MBTL60-007]